jgi:hypothetical protein
MFNIDILERDLKFSAFLFLAFTYRFAYQRYHTQSYS